ncbi:hypothetical protein EVAR_94902_1 [Eumeta japonica]|uniref:Uncharacterized protein n=1 Tax=Eumeta variegata TaxID=151549 RepID=A0A4C1VA56_EUMVA|nr:hypothetical protein EVAR_94902_1 [Eumeta japonica]
MSHTKLDAPSLNLVAHCTVQRTKLCRSELAANGILRRYYAPRPFLLRRIPILRRCDAFATNFTAAKFCAFTVPSDAVHFSSHDQIVWDPPRTASSYPNLCVGLIAFNSCLCLRMTRVS